MGWEAYMPEEEVDLVAKFNHCFSYSIDLLGKSIEEARKECMAEVFDVVIQGEGVAQKQYRTLHALLSPEDQIVVAEIYRDEADHEKKLRQISLKMKKSSS